MRWATPQGAATPGKGPPPWRASLGLALLVAAVLSPARLAWATPPPLPPPTAQESPAPDPRALRGPPQAVVAPALDVVDEVLPCGLRLVVARDDSLPVAALVLAVETGSEDDPADLPGLTHALAYQVLQGNRDLAPHAAAARIHDAGGYASLSIGSAQVRYESLVPTSALEEALWIESIRLRAVTVDEVTWPAALRTAGRDRPPPTRLPAQVRAAAHGLPARGDGGREVPPPLRELPVDRVARSLADRLTYDRATLVLVTPSPPREVAQLARARFADLPAAPREVSSRPPGPSLARIPGPPTPGATFVAPVPPGLVSLELARALCRGLNRQKIARRGKARPRLRCHLEEDPRRAVLQVRLTGLPRAQARGLLERQVQALLDPAHPRLLAAQLAWVRRELALDAAAPLPLARLLAMRAPLAPPPSSLDEALGLPLLASPERAAAHLARFARADGWIPVIPAPRPKGSRSKGRGRRPRPGKARPEVPASKPLTPPDRRSPPAAEDTP